MTKKSFLLFLAAAFVVQSVFLTSCSTDVDLLEEYKPITVVYGLLNSREDTQYIKVNKAFLGEGNALVMAQQSDSSNYQPGELNVILQKVHPTTGQVQQTITCLETTAIPKDDGVFSNPYQLLFYTTTPIDSTSRYNLVISRSSDAATITASTPVVKPITIQQPSSPTAQLNLGTTASYFVRWRTGADAKVFNLVMRFHYREYNISAGDTQVKFVDWNLGNQVAPNTSANQDVSIEIGGENLFKFLGAVLPFNANLIRDFYPTDTVELIITAGAEDFYTYLLVNEPSIGLIQEKPIFTNINNGVGIFSSRWKRSYFNRLNPATRDSLYYGRFTGNSFVDH
jgi:hypothetical protein